MPPSVYDRLVPRVGILKNRTAVFVLACWIARKNASFKRLQATFPLDRRALCARGDLGLTEDEIRGAITALLRVGYVELVPHPQASRYQVIDGNTRRLPNQYRFAKEFFDIFLFIARQMLKRGKSPRGRQNNINNINMREAPILGEKTVVPQAVNDGSPGPMDGAFAPKQKVPTPNLVVRGKAKPLAVAPTPKKAVTVTDLKDIGDDGLRGALNRLRGHVIKAPLV